LCHEADFNLLPLNQLVEVGLHEYGVEEEDLITGI